MVDRSTVQQATYDYLVGVLAARSDVPSNTSDAEKHVVLDEPDLDEQTPALSIRWFERDTDLGRGDVHVAELVRNNNDEVIDVRYGEELTLELEAAAVARTDQTAVSVYEDVRQSMAALGDRINTSIIHDAVEDVNCRDASPTAGNDRRAHILRIEVEYTSTFLRSDVTGSQLTPVRTVNEDVNAKDL